MKMTRPVARLTRASLVGTPVFIIAVFGGLTVHAQVQPVATTASAALPANSPSTAAAAAPAVDVESNAPDSVRLLVGRSTLVDVGSPIARVSLTSSDIADALVTSPSQLLVHGKGPGAISMFVWARNGGVRRFEVSVQRDLTRLTEQVKQLFPNERIEVRGNGRNVVLSGSVSNKDVVDRAINVALGYVDKREDVVTLLQVREGPASNQVMLRVRFAEVSRSALTEFGMSFMTSPTGIKNTVGRTSTQQFAAPDFQDLAWTKGNGNFGGPVTSAQGKFSVSDFLNLFFLSEKYSLGAVIRAMQSRGLLQSLAEPNLVAESGKEASFLAGGEFPIPVVQGSQSGSAVSIQFKEFGVRLSFTPTVIGDRVHLKVKPEVSSLDYANGVTLQGFRIPALSTRRTETELELRNGQTFAIAGLMNNQLTSSMQKIPGIGDIPILGQLFRSKAANKSQTELVVMITPEILSNDSTGVTNALPRNQEPFIAPLPDTKTVPQPPAAFGPDRRSSVSSPVPPQVAEMERREQERVAKAERDRLLNEARDKADAAQEKVEQDRRDAAAAEKAAKAAAKHSEHQADTQKVDSKAQAKEAAKAARQAQENQKVQAKLAEVAAEQQKVDQKRAEKDAKAQAKKDQEAAERAAKDAARQEKADRKTKGKGDQTEAKAPAGQPVAQVTTEAAPGADPQQAVAIAEARARAAAIASQMQTARATAP